MNAQAEKKHAQKDVSDKNVERILHAFQEMESVDDREKEETLYEEIRSRYAPLSEQEKERLFKAVMERIEVSEDTIRPLLKEVDMHGSGDPAWAGVISDLRRQIASPRLRLFRKISRFPGGLRFLLDFRGDLLAVQRFSNLDLRPLDLDIVLLLDLWFQEGFLYLEEITLDSSYRQLEIIKDRDLVHPMTSIEEMSRRLGKDRRCFALYHRLIPYEPIIFIEVALTRGIVETISEIIEKDSDRVSGRDADTAIFYSINNTQNGLAGIGLGKMLIGQVVDYLREDNEQIKNMATLSPVPGFWEKYLKPVLEGADTSFALKREDIPSHFSRKQAEKIITDEVSQEDYIPHFNRRLLSILSGEEWIKNEELKRSLHGPLVKIAYHHISKEKNPQGKPLNPVAGFHLGNGATVEPRNVHFLANPSTRGLQESCGIMVNYIYTATWLGQLRRSLGWFNRLEIRGMFSR